MYAPETHYNPLGSWYVDVIEVTAEGNTIIDTQNFKTSEQAREFSIMIMRGAFHCENCQQWKAEADMMGDDEPICLDCYTARRDDYQDSFDGMFGQPLEKLDELGVTK